MTTGKTIALTRWTFVGKVMSLLFNMLSRLVIAFLQRRKCLLISWLQSPSAVYIWDHFNMKMTLLSPWKIFRGLQETPCVGRGPAVFPPPLLTLCSVPSPVCYDPLCDAMCLGTCSFLCLELFSLVLYKIGNSCVFFKPLVAVSSKESSFTAPGGLTELG